MSEDGEHRPFPEPEHSITPRKPRTVGGAVFLAILGATLIGLTMVSVGAWRSGLTVIGGALMCGAVGRLVIPEANAGMLGIRRKLVDVATLATLGLGIVVMAAVIADRPV